MSNWGYRRELRTERMLLKLTPTERKFIDELQDKRQKAKSWEKISKTDVVIEAVRSMLELEADAEKIKNEISV